MSGFLNQNEINGLLDVLKNIKPDTSSEDSGERKTIKIYDFKRPERITKQMIRELYPCAEAIASEFKKFISLEYDIVAKINVVTIDQLTCEEFVRALPIPAPACCFTWMEGAGLFAMNPATFYNCFLGANPLKKHEPKGLEKLLFAERLSNPFVNILHSIFSKNAKDSLPEISDKTFESNPQFLFKHLFPTQMGVDIAFSVEVEGNEGMMNLFLNEDCLKSLKATEFFSEGKTQNVVPLALPAPNTIVEIGRFRLEDGEALKEKFIYEANRFAGEPLDVFKNGTFVGKGEAVIVEDNNAVRIVTKPNEVKQKCDGGFYNVKVIFGGLMTEENEKIEEGCILELNEFVNEPLKIVRHNRVIGWGELVVVDESFGVKVVKAV